MSLIFLDFSADSFPSLPRNQIPSILVAPFLSTHNQLMLPLFFFVCLSSRMGEQGGAAVPLKQI